MEVAPANFSLQERTLWWRTTTRSSAMELFSRLLKSAPPNPIPRPRSQAPQAALALSLTWCCKSRSSIRRSKGWTHQKKVPIARKTPVIISREPCSTNRWFTINTIRTTRDPQTRRIRTIRLRETTQKWTLITRKRNRRSSLSQKLAAISTV